MKKILIAILNIIAIALVLALAFIIVYPFIQFNNKESETLNVWIVDKTVPNTTYREHTGLSWFLDSEKIVNYKTNEKFNYSEDYYGFFPINKDEYEIKYLPSDIENPSLIYLADTYGVYVDDYLSDNIAGTKSELIYGGLEYDEIAKIKANLGSGNIIIGEFNTAAAPTNSANRDQLGEIFRMGWTGWSGRYFRDLSLGIEIPIWAVESYEKETGEEWNYVGEGFILVSEYDEIVVFEKDIDFGEDYLFISFDEKYNDEFGITKDIPYDYWFEFSLPNKSAEVIADFTLDVTNKGMEKLNELGLSSTFPAIIRNNNKLYTSYYFAGDFADGDITYKWWNYSGFAKLKNILPFGEKGDNSKFFWRCYIPLMSKIMSDIITEDEMIIETIAEEEPLKYNSRTTNDSFQIQRNGQWEDFFVKGVNIGSSTPGKWFTEFSNNEEMYIDWFEQIANMNANTIRIYTLLSPQFYTALEYYNKNNPDAQLWIYQEIWPEENPLENDYLRQAYNDDYMQEIDLVVDALHGNANIEYRRTRAYGIYTADVSPYIIGYLVGRELEPEEVISTNENNDGFSYIGEYLYSADNASPTEAWLAMSCDFVLSYEADTYNWQHPVGIVSWPTLDIVEHDSEWNISGDKQLEYNDKVSIDINNIETNEELYAGFFGAYHIYPNYPDFMNNENIYAKYTDDEGVFSYGGYLREFITNHKKYPALVAEFGLATGMGIAHSNPDGYNHGGLSEQEQGEGIIRMMKAIENEDYAGGIIFEWSDEWAKKTWTTEPYMIPYERNVMWHNMVDPEQNYGIISMEAAEAKSQDYNIEGEGAIRNIDLMANEEYLYIEIETNQVLDFVKENLIIGIDTYDRKLGNFRFSEDSWAIAPFGLEYAIQIKGLNNTQILVQPSYNISKGKYQSSRSYDGIYENISTIINKERITKSDEQIAALYFDYSQLKYGDFDNNSQYAWHMKDNVISIRIPWMLLNFSDPSEMRVLNDSNTIHTPLKDEISTTITDGIMISSVLIDNTSGDEIGAIGNIDQEPFYWTNWDLPSFVQRAKNSYDIIQEYFGKQ